MAVTSDCTETVINVAGTKVHVLQVARDHHFWPCTGRAAARAGYSIIKP
jgi:hypothetical protein